MPLTDEKCSQPLLCLAAPGELAPLITPTTAFYTVSKTGAGTASRQRPLAAHPRRRSQQPGGAPLPDPPGLPAIEIVKTLECISNFTAKCELTSFGCDLISTATWRGVRVADLLNLACGLKPEAVSLAVVSADEFSKRPTAERCS